MKLNNIVIIFLSLFIFYIIYSNYYATVVEDFSLESIIPTSSSSTTDASNNIYQYLAPLPSDNMWSQDTQNEWVEKFNHNLTSLDPSSALLTSPTFNGINYMTIASEEEAKSYIQNGIWPVDTYITNLYNNTIAKSNNVSEDNKSNSKKIWGLIQKIYPNRFIYQNLIGPSTLPQTAIIMSLNPSIGSGMINNNNRNLTCKSAIKGVIQQPDGTNITIPENGFYPFINNGYTLDYNIFESIPGLTFDNSPCNICGIDGFNYLSTKNQCKFSLNNPVAYDIYSGINKTNATAV